MDRFRQYCEESSETCTPRGVASARILVPDFCIRLRELLLVGHDWLLSARRYVLCSSRVATMLLCTRIGRYGVVLYRFDVEQSIGRL